MTEYWLLWWVWIAFALVLGLVELMLPGFIALGFAIGAAIMGIIVAVGAGLSLPQSLLAFAVLSLLAWLGLRRFFALRTGQVKHFDHDVND